MCNTSVTMQLILYCYCTKPKLVRYISLHLHPLEITAHANTHSQSQYPLTIYTPQNFKKSSPGSLIERLSIHHTYTNSKAIKIAQQQIFVHGNH